MLSPVDVTSIEYLAFNLRECDRAEVFAMRPYDNPLRLAWDANHMILNTGRGTIAWHKGKPIMKLWQLEHYDVELHSELVDALSYLILGVVQEQMFHGWLYFMGGAYNPPGTGYP